MLPPRIDSVQIRSILHPDNEGDPRSHRGYRTKVLESKFAAAQTEQPFDHPVCRVSGSMCHQLPDNFLAMRSGCVNSPPEIWVVAKESESSRSRPPDPFDGKFAVSKLIEDVAIGDGSLLLKDSENIPRRDVLAFQVARQNTVQRICLPCAPGGNRDTFCFQVSSP